MITTIKNKQSGDYAVRATEHRDELYVDLLYTTRNLKGTYEAPHLALIYDLMFSLDDEDVNHGVIIKFDDNFHVEHIDSYEMESDWEEVDTELRTDQWCEILGVEPFESYYDDRELDLLKFWLGYYWSQK
jgi:hypothetical protein